MLIVLPIQIVTFLRLKVFRKLLPFDLKRLYAKGATKTEQQNFFDHLQKNCTVFRIRYLIGRNHDTICQLHSSHKIHFITISNRELSDPLSNSVNILTVRFWFAKKGLFRVSADYFSFVELVTAFKILLKKKYCKHPHPRKKLKKISSIHLLPEARIKK